jgi:ribosome biogenesis GTPase A
MLFVFRDINRENLYYREYFFDFSYITCLNLSSISYIEKNEGKSTRDDFIAVYLQSLLYNNYDSYFTESGHKIIDQVDPLSNTPMTGIYLPIISVGTPGVGKSTFINILNGGRISKASSSDNPVTSKSAICDVRIPGNETEIQLDNKELKQEAFIRFIDTPGFDLEKDIDIALNEIKRIFKEFKDGKERIPVVLYFMNESG